MNQSLYALPAGLLVLLAACGGGDNNANSPTGPRPKPAPPVSGPALYKPCEDPGSEGSGLPGYTASPGGIWRGTMTDEVRKATSGFSAYVGEDGRFWSEAAQFGRFVGNLDVADTAFSGTGIAYSRGVPWSDGSHFSELSVSGKVTERDTLYGTFSQTSGEIGCFDLSYDRDLYELNVTIADLEGTWSTVDGWGFIWQMTIGADGVFVQDAPYDCEFELPGSLTVIDERFNLFALHREAPGCDSGARPLSGLVYLYPIPAVGPKEADGLVFAVYNDGQAYAMHYTRSVVASD
ncbi:MAG: hypothetical protein R3176_02430 [Woeseiaceae bacterium]|nr:hypothetical protein [Woeseiaceae bacterium]